MNKRTFLQKSLTLGFAGLATPALSELLSRYESYSPHALAGDEEFWAGIRGGYKLKSDYINLENGYYCFLPEETLEKYLSHIREVNLQGSYYMRTVQADNKKKVIARLAEVGGCAPTELALTRNTTESLDTVINGYTWKAGDEAIMAEQDYGSIVNQFKLMEK